MQRKQLMLLVDEMLTMQESLNEMTNGSDWRSGLTAKGKVIDWRRCIVMESAELIDSYPWKHWKSVDAKADLENVRVELVDIWHFLLSLILEKLSQQEARDLIIDVLEKTRFKDAQLTDIEQVKVHEKMMATALQDQPVNAEYLADLTADFLHSCKVAELDFQQLYEIYIAKNVLNKFRQDNGYKEGHYVKEWHGKEDNVVMFEIIDSMTRFNGEALYQSLEIAYQKL